VGESSAFICLLCNYVAEKTLAFSKIKKCIFLKAIMENTGLSHDIWKNHTEHSCGTMTA